ncbi:MAG: Uncharacterized protein FD141_90 [Fusobacteria bacterium]|nr:MAG: Uncharacterized protein FD141_90 [Fusobacteriota bacterium]KAF0229246.1 MAG: hypothetical protein FD182_1502 [Fusobacteriota bacterium]
MRKKVLITTVYKGYNYGTSLQAYASKIYISNLGYDPEIIGYKDGISKGRDIRIKKLIVLFLRTFWRPKLFFKTFSTYKDSFKNVGSAESKKAFLNFQEFKLQIKKFSWNGLKKYSSSDNILACLCGSDQIWNATSIYVDPIYYLRYAPQKKRVAFAPSFGKNEIPFYNRKIIKKYISGFGYLSIREKQGADIIKELTGKKVPVLIYPTLLLDKETWLETIGGLNRIYNEPYILLYFLDKPSLVALEFIDKLLEINKCKVISIPMVYDEFSNLINCVSFHAGPLEFIDLIANATFVCTDSFHGTAFSVNLNKPFVAFKRNYWFATDQSSRIVSLLEKLNLADRFISDKDYGNHVSLENEISFENSNEILECLRSKSKEYLLNAFSDIENKDGDYNEE